MKPFLQAPVELHFKACWAAGSIRIGLIFGFCACLYVNVMMALAQHHNKSRLVLTAECTRQKSYNPPIS